MGTMSRAVRRASLLFSRNPLIRPADRVLSAIAWLVMVIGSLVVPVAGAAGSVVHDQRAESAQVEQRTRHQVEATLQVDAVATVDYSGSPAKDTTAAAWWLGPDGRVHTGTIAVPTDSHAGDTKQIWIDGSGAAVGQPRTATSAVGDGVVAAMAIVTGVGVVLGGCYWLVRTAFTRRTRRSWARRWRETEPHWTGRVGREPA